ncbi:NAD(P)H-dependent oxidoreductase [Psychromonas sp. PT13]|uniref:NAD(P)H-dependent oxidoreductase n=1 Tax=Psychromonas sp. PT13 TaxID=3439547 RepID=UPI003EB71E07
MQKNKVLVLYAHPSQHRSEVNHPLFNVSRQIEGVTAVDLYGEYPSYNIDISKEQQRLLDHEVIIFQFPLFWYSTPAILKEWQDLVLEYGFAYGDGADALKDKVFMCVLSAGGKEEAYQSNGYLHYTIEELLRPLEQMANLSSMKYLNPFVLFGSRTAKEEGRLEPHLIQWKKLIVALTEGHIDIGASQATDQHNQYITHSGAHL